MRLFDAVIAGGGIIGSSIAWRLSGQGLRVALLDAREMGAEASSAAAGMLAPGGEIEERSPWNDFALESLRLYPDFVAELEAETGAKIDFQRLGAVDLAFGDADWKDLQERGTLQAELGIPSCPLSPEEIRRRVPLAGAEPAGGLFYPEDALVDPRQVMSALRAACRQGGVEVYEGTRVVEIRAESGSVRTVTAGWSIESAAAVLAAGAWSSLVRSPGVALPETFPVRGHLIGFQLEPGSLDPILRHGPTYLLQRATGFTVAGSSSEPVGFDRELNPKILADIQARAAKLLPALACRRPDDQWLGFRPAVEGGHPVIGRAGETRLWLAYGHYRNGILMAPATAARVASEITASSGRG